MYVYVCEGVVCMYVCVHVCEGVVWVSIHEAPIPDWYPEQVNLCL